MASVALFSWATGVLLVSVRLAMLFIATPVFGGIPVPNMAKVILVFGLSAGLAAGLPTLNPANADFGWLASVVLHEVIVGAAMASGLFAGFAAFHFGGRLLDFQIGFGIAGLFDIATRNTAPLLGTVFSMAAVLIFFAVDGHLIMLRILQMSFLVLPPGTGIGNLDISALIAYFGTCFVFGFALVAPIVLCLLLVDIGVAFMSRTMPQMHVFILALGMKVIVGLLMLAITLPFAGGLIQMIFESIFRNWNQVLGNG